MSDAPNESTPVDPIQGIVAALHDFRVEMESHHVEVVQRLTKLETRSEQLDDISKRITNLEGWRNKIAGALVLLSALFTAAYTYFARK